MNTYIKLYLLYSVFGCAIVQASEKTASEKSITLMQSILVGGSVGAAEVVFPGQLLSYAMNRAINKKPFILRYSYQGFTANALGQMPITAIQKSVSVMGCRWMQSYTNSPLSEGQKAAIAFFAGVSGACVDTPSNAIQLYLQDVKNRGKNSVQACKELKSASFRGFFANAVLKEGPFAVGYLMLADHAKDFVQKHITQNSSVALVLGGVGAGVCTAVITQPGAVLRNTLQADFTGAVYKNSWQAARKIYQQEGFGGLFKGFSARGVRVVVAIPLYVAYSQALVDALQK